MAGRKEHSQTRTELSSEYESWLKDIARIGPEPIADPIGIGDRLVDGRFEVVALLGRGGMGSVFEAIDRQDGRSVALKTFRGTRSERLFRLKREFRALADVRHENLVKLWELHNHEQLWFFTMEILRGENLRDALREATPNEIRRVTAGLASGLAALHMRGLVHRDVKPSNAIVLPSGRAVLVDFGIVADVTRVDASDGVAGTRAYMGPEQAAGNEPTSSDDLFSLGVVLFELLVGRLPSEEERAGVGVKRVIGSESSELAELADLCSRLLGPPSERPSAAQTAASLGVAVDAERGDVPFVGRERELGVFTRILDDVRAGRPNTVIDVRGGPGHGKTELLAAYCRVARDRGHAVLTSQCREREQVPFNALDSIIDNVATPLRALIRSGHLASDLEPLARLFPTLGLSSLSARSTSANARPPTFEDRQRAFALLAEVLEQIAGGAPLVIAIDDAQWADRDSFALLTSLLSSPSLSLVVVASTTRTRTAEEDERLAARLGARLEVLELGALDLASAQSLAMALLGNSTDAGDLESRARSIALEAQGVPLFVCELARPCDSTEPLDVVLRGSLAELDATAARALELLCVAQTAFTREMTLEALAGDRAVALEALDLLERGRLATARRRRGVTAVEPYHQRVRDAVDSGLSDAERLSIHRDIATAITVVNPKDTVGLSYHWQHAGELVAARQASLAAARSARDALAFDRAAELWGRALELGEPATTALLTARGEALEAAGRGAHAAEAYRQAAVLCKLSDAATARSLERRAAEQLLRAGHVDDGIDAIRVLLAAEGMPLPSSSLGALAQLVVERVRLRLQKGRTGDVDVDRLAVSWALAIGLSQVDPIRGALYQTRHLRMAIASGDPTRQALGMCAESMSAASKGPPGIRAKELLKKAERVGRDSSDPRVPAYLSLANASVSFLTGDFAGAREHAATATTLFSKCPGARWEQSTADRFHLTCLWHTGRLSQLATRTVEAVAESRALGDRYGLNQLRTTVLPPVLLLADQADAAEAELDLAWKSLSRRHTFLQHWQHLQASALVHLYRGDPRAALELFEKRFVGSGKFFLSRVKAVRVFTSYVRGMAAVGALAERPGDRDYERIAVRDIARLKREGPSARTVLLIEAQLQLVRGQEELARDSLRRGIALASELDLQLIVACAKACLGRLEDDHDLQHRSSEFFASHQVARPSRVTRMLMPAFGAERFG